MATFDQLSPEQRAIVELVLRRGQSYDQLSSMLNMPETRVRELARDALVALAPVSVERVEEDWRGQLADYVLGQQSGPESTATRGHLRRSEGARIWTSSLLDALETFYANGMPSIPEGERGRASRDRGRREKAPAAAPAAAEAPPEEEEERPRRQLSADAQAAVRRRRVMAGAGAAALLLALIVLVWPVGLLTGGDDEGGTAATGSGNGNGGGTPAAAAPQGQPGKPAGIAIVAQRGAKPQVVVQAAGLAPNKARQAYEVWLYNSPQEAKSLGAQVTDQRGTYQGAGPLPADYAKYQFIDVSREPIDENRSHSGQSVLRGKIGKLAAPKPNAGNKSSVLGNVVLAPPKS